jgi:hypothetical protein
MDKPEGSQPPKRRYPGIYEKGVPIILGVILLGVIVLVGVAVAVILGLF